MSRRLALALTLMATFAFTFPALTAANHSWGNYHWARTSNPFTLKLGDNVNSTWDQYLATTSSDWTTSTVLNTTIVAGSANPKNCRPTAGRAEVCNSSYGNNGWLGVAQIWASGSHITQGTVRVNDYYFNTAKYNTPAWRNMVMCQEVGHIFGLNHQDENFNNANLGTCMDYTSDPDGAGNETSTDNQHPNAGDYNQLLCIYDLAQLRQTLTSAGHTCTGTGHLDSTTTVAAAAPAGASPSGWGRLVAVTNGGRTSVFMAGAGDQVVISFVIWAN